MASTRAHVSPLDRVATAALRADARDVRAMLLTASAPTSVIARNVAHRVTRARRAAPVARARAGANGFDAAATGRDAPRALVAGVSRRGVARATRVAGHTARVNVKTAASGCVNVGVDRVGAWGGGNRRETFILRGGG